MEVQLSIALMEHDQSLIYRLAISNRIKVPLGSV
jgi:hypothetical protein